MSLTIEQATNAVEDNLQGQYFADFTVEIDKTWPEVGVLAATIYVGNTNQEAGQIRIIVEVVKP